MLLVVQVKRCKVYMSEFINDPAHYGCTQAFDNAKAEYMVWIVKEQNKEIKRVSEEFNEMDFEKFKERLQGVAIVPPSVVASVNLEERTALFQAPTAEKRNALRGTFATQRSKRARTWLCTEYGARSEFLQPLDSKEIRMLCAKLSPSDSKALAYGDTETLTNGCIHWLGGKNNGKASLERRGHRGRGNKIKRRRVVGPTSELMFNYWRTPLLPGQRLKRIARCLDPMCVNPYHYKLK